MKSKRISTQFRKSLTFLENKRKSSKVIGSRSTHLRDFEGVWDDDDDDDDLSLPSSLGHEEQPEGSDKETTEEEEPTKKKGSVLKKFRKSVVTTVGMKLNNNNNKGSRSSFAKSPVSKAGRASFSHAMTMMRLSPKKKTKITSSSQRTVLLQESSPVSSSDHKDEGNTEFDNMSNKNDNTHQLPDDADALFATSSVLPIHHHHHHHDSPTTNTLPEQIDDDDNNQVDAAVAAPAEGSRRKLECETNAYVQNLIYACTTDESDDDLEGDDLDHYDSRNDYGQDDKGKEEQEVVDLHRTLNELQTKFDQQQLKIKVLEDTVANHESKAMKQQEQITLYKEMYEDVQEDYSTAMKQYNTQVEQNATMLGVVDILKERVWECETKLQEKQNQIQTMEEQLSKLQEQQTDADEDHHDDNHQSLLLLLEKLQTDNERLKKMVDIQKRSLYQVVCTASGAAVF